MLVLPAVKLKKKKKKKKKTKEEGGVVVMPSRRCYFHRDCKSFLYGLPRDSGLKEQWLKLIFNSVPETYNPNIALCAAHFKEDCFLNIREFKAGFAQKLVLKDGAVPTVTSAEASGPHPNKSQYDTGFAQKLLLKQQAVPNIKEPSGTPQTVIKRTHVISDSGSSCCKSVGTDLSMLDIDDFISEISQLKKEVALLEEKLRERGDQLKGREHINCCQQLSEERSRDAQDSELSLTLLCYTDSNPTDAQESVCESHQAFQDGSGLSLHGSTDQTFTQSQGSVCNGSVELEDCRNPMDIKGGPTADGEEYYEHDYFIPSDENSCSASDGETSEHQLTAQSHSCITSETSVTSQGHTKPKLFTCGSHFSTLQEKRRHAKVHRVKKDFHCEQCGKVYSSSYMKDHMKTHSDKISFLCCVCGKHFRTKGKLVAHKRIHTGEKPYKCPHCEKRFSCSSNMRTHVRRHTNKRRFSCSLFCKRLHACLYCKKKCMHLRDLKGHKKIHNSEGPFLCSHCGKKFNYQSTLRIHQKVHMREGL